MFDDPVDCCDELVETHISVSSCNLHADDAGPRRNTLSPDPVAGNDSGKVSSVAVGVNRCELLRDALT